MKLMSNKQSTSSLNKSKRSSFWSEQSKAGKNIDIRCSKFLQRENIEIRILTTTTEATSFSAIVDTFGVIVLK